MLCFQYSPITEPILSASLTGNFAAFTANQTFFGVRVNMVQRSGADGSMVDLSDGFFGTAPFPDPPKIDVGPVDTGVVSAPIPSSFFPTLANIGNWFEFTDTGDGVFAIDYLSLDIVTASGVTQAFFGTPDGFGIGIPTGGNLPAPLPDSLPFGTTGTGLDESISSKSSHWEVPEPGTVLLLAGGLLLLPFAARKKRRSRPPNGAGFPLQL